ncbi:MAG: hypothetical protein M1831_000082 [Alyxoria varia]|nr:MAG: hypothetical protein M1831_000082 [Alyxoria varia]
MPPQQKRSASRAALEVDDETNITSKKAKRTANPGKEKAKDSSSQEKPSTSDIKNSEQNDAAPSDVQNQQQPSPFLRLPREIRDMIYEYSLACAEESKKNSTTYIVPTSGKFNYEPGLLHTCRQIQNEALPVFYARNIFVVNLDYLDFSLVEKWLNALGKMRGKLVKRIGFFIEGPMDFPQVAGHLQMLETILSTYPSCAIKYFGAEKAMNIYHQAIDAAFELRSHGLQYHSIALAEVRYGSIARLIDCDMDSALMYDQWSEDSDCFHGDRESAMKSLHDDDFKDTKSFISPIPRLMGGYDSDEDGNSDEEDEWYG